MLLIKIFVIKTFSIDYFLGPRPLSRLLRLIDTFKSNQHLLRVFERLLILDNSKVTTPIETFLIDIKIKC